MCFYHKFHYETRKIDAHLRGACTACSFQRRRFSAVQQQQHSHSLDPPTGCLIRPLPESVVLRRLEKTDRPPLTSMSSSVSRGSCEWAGSVLIGRERLTSERTRRIDAQARSRQSSAGGRSERRRINRCGTSALTDCIEKRRVYFSVQF